MSGLNFNYLYAPVPLTVSDRFRSNFQDVLVHQVVQHIARFLCVTDLRSSGGHDFVMLSLWENIQIAPTPKVLDTSVSFHHFCASLPQ